MSIFEHLCQKYSFFVDIKENGAHVGCQKNVNLKGRDWLMMENKKSEIKM